MSGSAHPTMFCRVCKYPLASEREEPRCPECGSTYDPADESTYLTLRDLRNRSGRRFLRALILWVLLLSPLTGILDLLLFADGPMVVSSLLLGVASLTWCVNDARIRNHRLGRLFQMLILTFPIALLAYLLQTRGLRGLLVGVAAFGIGVFATFLSLLSHSIASYLGLR